MALGAKRITGLAAAFATALNGSMVMPLIVLALNRIPGITESSATVIASAEIGGIALYSLLCPRLLRHGHKLVTLGGIAAMVAGQLLTHFADTIPALTLTRLLTGLGEGALFSLITHDVAAEPEAERIWGLINLVGGVCMGFLLYGLSMLDDAAGGRGAIFLWLALYAAVLGPLVLLIRPQSPQEEQAKAPVKLPTSIIALILFVIFLVYGVQAGQWAVTGYMGEQSRLAPATVGFYLAMSSILGFVGAIVPAMTRNPHHRLRWVAVGLAIMGFALYGFFNLHGDVPFFGGQILLNAGFYMVTPFMTGLLTESDKDGVLVLRTLIIAMLGAGVGTALTGELFVDGGPALYSALCVATIGVALVCAVRVFHWAVRRIAAHAEAK